jgi:cytochrome P450
MSWMLHTLMTKPSLWEECAAEAFAVCCREPLRYEHLAQLPVLEAVIYETLRLFPPVPIIQNAAVASHSVFSDDPNSARQRLDVKVGTQIHIDIHVIHRLKQHWGADAEEFDHTRWLAKTRMQLVPGQKVDAAGAPVHTSIVTLRPRYGVRAMVMMRDE